MFRRKREASDYGAEVDAHIELETERLQEQGLGYEDARTAALRAFGNVTQAQERFNEFGRWLWWDHFWQAVRYGFRMLRKKPALRLPDRHLSLCTSGQRSSAPQRACSAMIKLPHD